MNNSQFTVYHASWVCPVDQPPIANAAVTVNERSILSVGRFADAFDSISRSQCKVIDLGVGAIIPGLVNAHSHLEFSDLEQPLGRPGIDFTDWIRLVVSRRQNSSQDSNLQTTSSNKSSAIERGINESLESGVWAIGEIATLPLELDHYRRHQQDRSTPDMLLTCFLEQLGRDDSSLDQKRSELDSFFRQHPDANSCLRLGSSPHAPYSVAPNLLRQICQQSTSAGLPLAMHLAESLSERELLEKQTGRFVSLLQDFGVWDPASFQSGFSIGEIIRIISHAPLSLIVHGNYLSAQELDIVAASSNRMSIVFCPRTHHFFQHSDYPIEQILLRGINICLGTDSRASNPDLDLHSESKHVANSFPYLDADRILAMATINGATALGISQDYGSITQGKRPALSFISHPDAGSVGPPSQWMFDTQSTCSPLWDQQ